MMQGTISRRRLLAHLTVAAAIPSLAMRNASAAPGTATPSGTSGGLTHRGINYDVGTRVSPEFTSRPDSHRAYLQSELETIRDDLHCTSVGIFGGDSQRLIEGATAATAAGLDVRLQPRLVDAPGDHILTQVAEIAQEVDSLNTAETEVVFDVGCELTLLASGIVPGATFEERFAYFMDHLDELPAFNEQLNALLEQVAGAARESFHGRLTYGSGSWEQVDWSGFDIVGVDLYRDKTNAAGYLDLLRSYQQHGKPVWMTEFGCCCYEGAADLGGSAFNIVDWSADPPRLNDSYTRSESVQAVYITDLLDLFETEGVDGAFIYQFIEPYLPHNPDPQYDLDMAAYSVVKTSPADSANPYETTGYWEPKGAFAAIADRYGAKPAATPLAIAS